MIKIFENERNADFAIWSLTQIFKKRTGNFLIVTKWQDPPDRLHTSKRNCTGAELAEYCKMNEPGFDIKEADATIKINDPKTFENIDVKIISVSDIEEGHLFVVEFEGLEFSIIKNYDGTILSQHDWQGAAVTVEEIGADYVDWIDVTPVKRR